MKKILIAAAGALLLFGGAMLHAQQNPGLPIVEHNGETLYFYTAKSGESVYGILTRFGWDENTFNKYNPKASEIKKGMLLYYPLENAQQQLPEVTPVAPEPFITVNNPNDTVRYNPPKPVVDVAVANDSAAPAAVVALGDTVALPDGVPAEGVTMVYEVKAGDTLYQLARTYNTTIENLFRENPGLTPADLAAGQKMHITPGKPGFNLRRMAVNEKKMIGKTSYKTVEGDTWQSIALSAGISEELLRAANEHDADLEKGKKINIPITVDTLVVKTIEYIDELEASPLGRANLYARVHGLGTYAQVDSLGMPAGVPADANLNIAVVIPATGDTKKRDMEFVRGFLLALKNNQPVNGKLNLAVRAIDAGDSIAFANDSVIKSSRLVITTYDKDFPESFADYCEQTGKTLVNVFDAKSHLYEQYANMIQMLSPSQKFYEAGADFLLAAKPDAKYIFVAEDEVDGECISLILLERLIRNSGSYETIPTYAALNTYRFTPGQEYVIVSDITKKPNLVAFADNMGQLLAKQPGLNLSVVGRPGWIVYADQLAAKLQKIDTYMPSRFYLDATADNVKAFEQHYLTDYGTNSVKSYPGYAAMGYDVADYFLKSFNENGGDWNQDVNGYTPLQIEIRPSRPSLWQGAVNEGVYLLHFTPYNTVDKIRL